MLLGNMELVPATQIVLYVEFTLIITNTVLKQMVECKPTWMHPQSKHWYLIDYIIMREIDKTNFRRISSKSKRVARDQKEAQEEWRIQTNKI